MGRQRNRPPVNELENSPEEVLNEMEETSNLSDIEFKLIIINMFNSMKKEHRNCKKKRTSQK